MSDVATTSANTGAQVDDSSLTEEKLAEYEELANEKDLLLLESLSSDQEQEGYSLMSLPEGEYYSLSVTNYKQETGYWCGPASVRQSLSFHKTKSGSSTSLPSQTTLASKAGTTSDGSTTTGLVTALNNYKSTYGLSGNPYVAADIENASNPQSTFETRIKGVLKDQTNAPILLIQTKYLNR
ncbi:C39 family peptidase [Cytobacillus spongiae]|uniref:C39 family peptidase n=1 Tax=Cytobacillus spongiae TaxID=2901381 RepID=UPI001F2975BB|nr:C39 family peptidase [Cytobacillus spongiae]UII54747.1 C39 family peptidase [Cytobacillus spongiae]